MFGSAFSGEAAADVQGPTPTKSEVAFRALRDAIETGRYQPREHLRVQQLVEELGMSPTPIREALRLLQAEGLVVHHPHRGTVVAEFSPDDATEIYRVRLALEPLGAEMAAELATDEQRAEIRALHEELGRAIEGGRSDAAELNNRWHRAIMAASGSRHLQDFVARLWQAIPQRAIWFNHRAETSYAQHDAITQAIERRDVHGARDGMRAHLEFGIVSTVEHLRNIGHTGRS